MWLQLRPRGKTPPNQTGFHLQRRIRADPSRCHKSACEHRAPREKGCLDQLANCTVSERLDAPIGDTAPASRLIIDDLLTLQKTTPQP